MSVLCKLKYLIETDVPEEHIFINVRNIDDENESFVTGIEKLENEIDELEIDVEKQDNRFDYEKVVAGSEDIEVDEDYHRIPFDVKVANLGDMDISEFVKEYIGGNLSNKQLSYGEEGEIQFELIPVMTMVKKINDNHARFEIEWNVV